MTVPEMVPKTLDRFSYLQHAITKSCNAIRNVTKPITKKCNAIRNVTRPLTKKCNTVRNVTNPITKTCNAVRNVAEPLAKSCNGIRNVPRSLAEKCKISPVFMLYTGRMLGCTNAVYFCAVKGIANPMVFRTNEGGHEYKAVNYSGERIHYARVFSITVSLGQNMWSGSTQNNRYELQEGIHIL